MANAPRELDDFSGFSDILEQDNWQERMKAQDNKLLEEQKEKERITKIISDPEYQATLIILASLASNPEHTKTTDAAIVKQARHLAKQLLKEFS